MVPSPPQNNKPYLYRTFINTCNNKLIIRIISASASGSSPPVGRGCVGSYPTAARRLRRCDDPAAVSLTRDETDENQLSPFILERLSPGSRKQQLEFGGDVPAQTSEAPPPTWELTAPSRQVIVRSLAGTVRRRLTKLRGKFIFEAIASHLGSASGASVGRVLPSMIASFFPVSPRSPPGSQGDGGDLLPDFEERFVAVEEQQIQLFWVWRVVLEPGCSRSSGLVPSPRRSKMLPSVAG